MAPSKYVRRRRALIGARRIADGETVLEVVIVPGYGSQSAFSRTFRRALGVTPTEWAHDRTAAHNAIAWKGQTEPLSAIGFTVVDTGAALTREMLIGRH